MAWRELCHPILGGGASSWGCRRELADPEMFPVELTELAKPWKWPEAVAYLWRKL